MTRSLLVFGVTDGISSAAIGRGEIPASSCTRGDGCDAQAGVH
jgi:hypothetical protein